MQVLYEITSGGTEAPRISERIASARFHSPRTQQILHHRAQCMAHRMEEALCRQQVVHVPGQTIQQRDHVLQSILNSPDIVPNLDLDMDGTWALERQPLDDRPLTHGTTTFTPLPALCHAQLSR